MFTGIVRWLGRVHSIKRTQEDAKIDIKLPKRLPIKKGDSVCVNGVCLTVTSTPPKRVTFDAMFETLALTDLGELKKGDRVNLEPSLTLQDPLGGHLVVGHVDEVGKITKKDPIGDGVLMRISAGREITKMIAKKGCVAVDGISLTVTTVKPTYFEIALIPYTLEVTTLGTKKPGAKVNLEVDLLARYVHAFMGSKRSTGLISKEFLKKAGFVREDQ